MIWPLVSFFQENWCISLLLFSASSSICVGYVFPLIVPCFFCYYAFLIGSQGSVSLFVQFTIALVYFGFVSLCTTELRMYVIELPNNSIMFYVLVSFKTLWVSNCNLLPIESAYAHVLNNTNCIKLLIKNLFYANLGASLCLFLATLFCTVSLFLLNVLYYLPALWQLYCFGMLELSFWSPYYAYS